MCNYKFLVLSLMVLILSSCSSKDKNPISQGGGVTETTNGIAARIISTDGIPVEDVEIRLILRDSLDEDELEVPSEFILIAYSDSDGYFEFDKLPDCRINLIAEKENNMAILFDATEDKDSLINIVLSEKLVLEFKNDSSYNLKAMAVTGTDIQATLTDSAYFQFLLPSGEYGISALDSNDLMKYLISVVQLQFNETKIDNYELYTIGFLVDDFNDRNMSTTTIYDGLGYGNWYASCSDDDCVLGPNQDSTNSGLFDGEYLSVTYEQGSAMVGFSYWDIQGDQLKLDLRSLESICYKAKGDGKLAISIISKIDSETEAQIKTLEAVVELPDLTDDWNDVCINVSEFEANDQWNEYNDDITNIEFTAEDGFEFFLDDIYLRGVLVHELLK